MAKKSNTQRAKASAARQARKELAKLEAEEPQPIIEQPVEEKTSKVKSIFAKSEKKEEPEPKVKPKAEPPKKKRFQFFKDIRAELKRVTWPTRKDVLQWSGVVIGALLFFGVFVALLDNAIITPLLVGISSLGA
ncbi:MAG: preprotein translocase subunit SecE [Eggerthellaceae bacterium]|nr:preprotein translocase subunit SecE [Eggerthellaceae bacterium]